MSNDVHLAKVSKIQRSGDISKGEGDNRRSVVHCKGAQDMQSDMKISNYGDNIFRSISPRRASTKQSLGEMESPEHTQRDTNESDNNISSCSTLDIVNKVENLSMHKLETQVRELTQRLQAAEQERSDMQRQLEDCNAEKELCFHRLEVVSAAHECRITEMHCVIAELSKKLRTKQENTILEEQEPEGSEVSYQEGSVYNSELNLTNPEVECQTEPIETADHSTGECFTHIDDKICAELADGFMSSENINKCQVEALQEEVLHLKAEIALLQSEMANSMHLKQGPIVEEQQNIEFYGEEVEANDSNYSMEHVRLKQKCNKVLNNLALMDQKKIVSAFKHFDPILSPQKEAPIPKMAERVKLRCATKTDFDNITAADVLNTEIKNSEIEEHFIANLKENKSLVVDSIVDPVEMKSELQRLQRKVEHLKMRNTVLSLTLNECKEHCEHLYLLCGKYESNAVALQLAVNCTDRAIEAYDVMLALLESNLVVIKDESSSAEESRKAVESVARHLLDRLESEKNICENSLGPWQNSFSIPDKVCAPWTSDDDSRLRYHVSKLKGHRSTIQNTIVILESPFSDFYEKSRLALENSKEFQNEKKSQIDLEMAVLMQELLNLREENIALKAKSEEIDNERQYAMEKVEILQEALKQLQLHISLDSKELFHKEKGIMENRVSYSEAEHAAVTEQQLVEALTRESELKGRIQTLIASVSATQKFSDEKYCHLQSNIKDLQKSNLSLSQILEHNKRRYQAKVKKLEQKIVDISLELERKACNESSALVQESHRTKRKNDSMKAPYPDVPETTL